MCVFLSSFRRAGGLGCEPHRGGDTLERPGAVRNCGLLRGLSAERPGGVAPQHIYLQVSPCMGKAWLGGGTARAPGAR